MTRLCCSKSATFVAGLKQNFIGDLNPTNGRWREFLPPDSILAWRNAKNTAATHYSRCFYITNEQGFMSTGAKNFYYPRQKNSNALRIIVLGGSTVMGQGAFVPEENLPAQIERVLKENKRKTSIEVINAGVGGYNSSQELLYLMSELVYYKPDIVIVYDGWNDESYNNIMLAEYGENFGFLKTSTHYMLEHRLENTYTVSGSALLFVRAIAISLNQKLENFALWTLTKRIFVKFTPIYRRKDVKNQKYNPLSVTMYKENLELMILLSNYYEFKIAIFLQPIMGVDNKKYTIQENKWFYDISDIQIRRNFYKDARLMFRSLKDKFNSNGEVCIEDISLSFQDTAEMVYADSGHLLVSGNKIIAQNIVEHLNRCNLLEVRYKLEKK